MVVAHCYVVGGSGNRAVRRHILILGFVNGLQSDKITTNPISSFRTIQNIIVINWLIALLEFWFIKVWFSKSIECLH